MHEVGQVTTIVQDHVQGLSAGERSECLFDAPLVLFFGLTLPRKDGYASCGNSGSSVILGGEDVLKESAHEYDRAMVRFRIALTHDDQVTSAPRAVRVSIRTAV